MKKSLLILITLIMLALVSWRWWSVSVKPVSDDPNVVRFVIPKGQGASQIANKLKTEGLVRSPLAFKFYVQLTGRTRKIIAGEYELSGNVNLIEIVRRLLRGPKEVWVTIPEGLRREQVVELFIVGLSKNGNEIAVFRKEFLIQSKDLEGYLFPETYLFPKNISAQKVVTKMEDTFEAKTQGLPNLTSERGGLTYEEKITLASLIERETRLESERSVVSGIMLNRLNIGMALQVDATTQYAIGTRNCANKLQSECEWWPILSRADLEIDSPYNTYKFTSLPPAPIASPGLSSIKAALNPSGSEYFYYIHDPSGQIHYAATLSEHNRNIAKYLDK